MKRFVALALCAAMVLARMPFSAFAEPAATRVAENIAPDLDLPDNDNLFTGYLEQLFYGRASFFGTAAGSRLSGDEKLLYDALVPLIQQVACGQRESTVFLVGQPFTDTDGTEYPVDTEVQFTGQDISLSSARNVMLALLSDYPYELYWFDKVAGCSCDEVKDIPLVQICFIFSVAANYGTGEDYCVNTRQAAAAVKAVEKSGSILDRYASMSDYEKLLGYANEICALVSYDFAAADGGYFSMDNDPWQLVHVFDGDSSTNVVCEGYSKAFMYLCDQTVFAEDIASYTVTGTMDGGNHMWNVVSINGKNYLVDVTNSDAGASLDDGALFLAGASGSAAYGYRVDHLTYLYDDDSKALWGTGEDSILNLESLPYDPDHQDDGTVGGSCGENVIWRFEEATGTLTISGAGQMDDYFYGSTLPWYDQKGQILTVVVEPGVTSIGACAFYGCYNVSSVSMPDSITTIGDRAFHGCTSLTGINIPDSVTSIGSSAFSHCTHLTDVRIPDGVASINAYTFSGCSRLTGVHIPDTVTSIGMYAFELCTGMESITIPENVTSIGSSAFYACTSLTDVKLSQNLRSIGVSAFNSCLSLTEIVIPETVTTLDDYAFCDCRSLTSIHIPDSVVSIGESAFSGCSGLIGIDIPTGVASIDNSTFSGCSGLTSVHIPDSVRAIGSSAFYGCSGLTDIVIPDSVISISNYAFSDCTGLTSVEIPRSVTSIGSYAFSGCNKLSTIEFTGNAPEIGREAFSGVRAMAYYPGDNESWTPLALQNYGGWLTWTIFGTPVTPFIDVANDAFYLDSVLWAVENGITTGTSGNTFSPEDGCTRSQIVTFLWRAAGEPAPMSQNNPFVDVPANAYYYDAVLWAVEQGITNGLDDTQFGPDQECTRGQVATFLWRYAEEPTPSGTNPFTDVTAADFYYDSVLWAVENGVTKGMGDGIFAPNNPCTRGQIVTFLFRALTD